MDTDSINKNSAKLSNNSSKDLITSKSGQQEEKFELISALNNRNMKQNLLKLIRIVDYQKDDTNNINDLKTTNFNTLDDRRNHFYDNNNASISSSSLYSKQNNFGAYNNYAKFQSNGSFKTDKQCRSNSPMNSNQFNTKQTIKLNPQGQRSQSPYHPNLIRPQHYTNRNNPKPDKPFINRRPGDVYQKLHENSISPKFRDTGSPLHLQSKIISQYDCAMSRNFSSREIHQITKSMKSMNSQSRERNLNKTTRDIEKSSSHSNQINSRIYDLQNNSKIIKVLSIEKNTPTKSTKTSANSFYQNSRKSPLLQSKMTLRQNESVDKFNKTFNSEVSLERQKESSMHKQKSQHHQNQYLQYNTGMKLNSNVVKKDYQVHNFNDFKYLESQGNELINKGCQGKVPSLIDLHSERQNSEHSFTELKQYNLKKNLNNLRMNGNEYTKTSNNLDKVSRPNNSASTKVIRLFFHKLINNRIEQQKIQVLWRMRPGFGIKRVKVIYSTNLTYK